MPRPCQICKSNRRIATDNDIVSGKFSVKEIALRHRWTGAAIYVHKKHMRPREMGDVAPAFELAPVVAPPELPVGASDLEKVDADIKWIEERRQRLIGKAVAERDLAALTGQLLTARRLRAKIAGGEITPGMYARSPHFHRIWDKVVEMLEEKHPKAMKDVVEVISEVTGLEGGRL